MTSIASKMARDISFLVTRKEKDQTRIISPVSGYGQPLRKELLRGVNCGFVV